MSDDFENMIQRKSKQGQYFTEKEIKLSIYQLLKGLEYIHTKGNGKTLINRNCTQRSEAREHIG
jgi:serine/threonine protein kinase